MIDSKDDMRAMKRERRTGPLGHLRRLIEYLVETDHLRRVILALSKENARLQARTAPAAGLRLELDHAIEARRRAEDEMRQAQARGDSMTYLCARMAEALGLRVGVAAWGSPAGPIVAIDLPMPDGSMQVIAVSISSSKDADALFGSYLGWPLKGLPLTTTRQLHEAVRRTALRRSNLRRVR